MSEDRVECRTPTEGRDGITRIPRWKYDVVRAAILDVVRNAGDAGFAFDDLKETVGEKLSADQRDKLGSLGWHLTVVKLNMEVEGELRRIPKVTPQRIVVV